MVCLKKEIIVVLPKGFGNSDIYGTKYSRKNASFLFHRLENVCSRGKSFGTYSKATSCESKKNRIELSLVLPHSGNQPSLTEKFDIVYGSAEQSEQWLSDTLLTK